MIEREGQKERGTEREREIEGQTQREGGREMDRVRMREIETERE